MAPCWCPTTTMSRCIVSPVPTGLAQPNKQFSTGDSDFPRVPQLTGLSSGPLVLNHTVFVDNRLMAIGQHPPDFLQMGRQECRRNLISASPAEVCCKNTLRSEERRVGKECR